MSITIASDCDLRSPLGCWALQSSMRNQATVPAVFWVLTLAICATALGQASSIKAGEPPAALARRAVEELIIGEDAATDSARRSAYREGLALAERALAADPVNADAHFARFANRGRLLLMDHPRPDPFELLHLKRELDRTLEINPNHPDALTAKGGIYRQLPRILGGSLTKARECLTRAVAIDPDNVGARVELALTYRDSGHPVQAVSLLQQAADIAVRRGRTRKAAEINTLLRQMVGP